MGVQLARLSEVLIEGFQTPTDIGLKDGDMINATLYAEHPVGLREQAAAAAAAADAARQYLEHLRADERFRGAEDAEEAIAHAAACGAWGLDWDADFERARPDGLDWSRAPLPRGCAPVCEQHPAAPPGRRQRRAHLLVPERLGREEPRLGLPTERLISRCASLHEIFTGKLKGRRAPVALLQD